MLIRDGKVMGSLTHTQPMNDWCRGVTYGYNNL
jgi:hypothetical protein